MYSYAPTFKGLGLLKGKVVRHGVRRVIEGDVGALLGVGLYTFTETSQIVSQALDTYVTRTNLTRWAQGRKTIAKDYAPIIAANLKIDDSYLLTFVDLVELFTIAALRQRRFPLPAIRRAYDRAHEKYGSHPFATRDYFVRGKGIFSPGSDDESDMEELATGRVAFKEIVKPLLENVSYIENKAAMFSPLGTSRSVILDPERAFGSPINKQTGVRTAILYGMHENGEAIDRVAHWYGVSLNGVRDAIEYESELREAA